VLKAQVTKPRKPRRPRPKEIAAGPYKRSNTGSSTQSTLTALEALIEIGEEILDRLPAVEDDD